MGLEHAAAVDRPLVAWTLGDVAGIGPEIALKAWQDPEVHAAARVLVVGSERVLRTQAGALGLAVEIRRFDPDDLEAAARNSRPDALACVDPSPVDVGSPPLGQVHPDAGRAAYDYLIAAVDWALAGRIHAVVTLPIHKETLRAAGLPYPGHTEILAERTGAERYGMMLYRRGLGVLHVTLHTSLRNALDAITVDAVHEKIALLDRMMRRLGVDRPRLAVAAVNPHASDGGLFGDEERAVVEPAVELAVREGFDAAGPIPADTLFVRAARGEFDGVVAMYHDQGHIALKLLGWREAVNITVGLPIVRTSVAHGTGYDIVGKGVADPTSLKEAQRTALLLARRGPDGAPSPRPASAGGGGLS
jgi:4-hydroxythreonine-4-phosphate dehydrogenase